MLRTLLITLATLTACAPAEPEPTPLPPVEMAPNKGGMAVKGPAPKATGPNAMTRSGSAAIAGQAELLAACLGKHPTTGKVTLAITVADGAVTKATVADGGAADEAFSGCLATRAVGMPFATDGESEMTLTAM